MIFCKLVDKGFIKKSFFLEFDTIKQCQEYLDQFEWPKGRWIFEEEEEEL